MKPTDHQRENAAMLLTSINACPKDCVLDVITQFIMKTEAAAFQQGEEHNAVNDHQDYQEMMERFSIFLDYATGGRLTKTNYPIGVMKAEMEAHVMSLTTEAFEEGREHERDLRRSETAKPEDRHHKLASKINKAMQGALIADFINIASPIIAEFEAEITGWKPIDETAKDGRKVDLLFKGRNGHVWRKTDWYFYTNSAGDECWGDEARREGYACCELEPTHYRKITLPAQPEKEGEG